MVCFTLLFINDNYESHDLDLFQKVWHRRNVVHHYNVPVKCYSNWVDTHVPCNMGFLLFQSVKNLLIIFKSNPINTERYLHSSRTSQLRTGSLKCLPFRQLITGGTSGIRTSIPFSSRSKIVHIKHFHRPIISSPHGEDVMNFVVFSVSLLYNCEWISCYAISLNWTKVFNLIAIHKQVSQMRAPLAARHEPVGHQNRPKNICICIWKFYIAAIFLKYAMQPTGSWLFWLTNIRCSGC